MPEIVPPHDPDEKPLVPDHAGQSTLAAGTWDGPTYYGRSQLKSAPFENWVVGGYVFLAGLSGSASLISALVDAARGRRGQETVRRGRYLSLLGPTIGSVLLIYDLHTPKRFYNMLRIVKRTSPMSIGTWILMAFSACAGISAIAQFIADRLPRGTIFAGAARAAHVPAAVAGMGLSTYTAALLSATSTPLWAASPRGMAIRFASSSVATGAAALSLGERSARTKRDLDTVAVAALTAELAATLGSHRAYRETGVSPALEGGWGAVEKQGATGLGVMAPLVANMAAMAMSRGRPGRLSDFAALAVLGGGLLLRVSMMAAGDESAARPDISFRFSQPRNLPPPEMSAL